MNVKSSSETHNEARSVSYRTLLKCGTFLEIQPLWLFGGNDKRHA